MTPQASLRDLEEEFGTIYKALPNLIKKRGEIKVRDSCLTGLRNAIRKHRRDGANIIPSRFVVDLVTLLDNAKKEVCSRLNDKLFFAFVELVLNSEYCLECERGIYLLAKSIHQDSTQKTEQELIARKKVIGEDCAYTLLMFFTNVNKEEGMRQWVGILLQQLLRDCHESVQRLKEKYPEALRTLGQVLIEDTNDISKTVCAELIRTILAAEVAPESLWPLGTNSRVYETFPIDFIPGEENRWHRQLVDYMNALSEADTQSFNMPDSNGCFYFPSGVETTPESDFEGRAHHYLYFWITKDNISILTPISPTYFYTRLEFSRDLVAHMGINEGTFLLSQKAEDFQDLVIKLNSEYEDQECRINSAIVRLNLIRVAFRSDMSTELLEDIQRMDLAKAPVEHILNDHADHNANLQHGSISNEQIDTNSSPKEKSVLSQNNVPEAEVQEEEYSAKGGGPVGENYEIPVELENQLRNPSSATPVEDTPLTDEVSREKRIPSQPSVRFVENDDMDELQGDPDSVHKPVKLNGKSNGKSSHGGSSKRIASARVASIEILKKPSKKASQAKLGTRISQDSSKEGPAYTSHGGEISPRNKTSKALAKSEISQGNTAVPGGKLQTLSSDENQSYDASTPKNLPKVVSTRYNMRNAASKTIQLPDTQRNSLSQVVGNIDVDTSPPSDHTTPNPTSDRSSEPPSISVTLSAKPPHVGGKRMIKQATAKPRSPSKSRFGPQAAKATDSRSKNLHKSDSRSSIAVRSQVDGLHDSDMSDDEPREEYKDTVTTDRNREKHEEKRAAPLKAKKPLTYGKGSASAVKAIKNQVAVTASVYDLPDDDENDNSEKVIATKARNDIKGARKPRAIASKNKGNKTKKKDIVQKKHQSATQAGQKPQRTSQRQAAKDMSMKLHEGNQKNGDDDDNKDDDDQTAKSPDQADIDDSPAVTLEATSIALRIKRPDKKQHAKATEQAKKLNEILDDGMLLSKEQIKEPGFDDPDKSIPPHMSLNSQSIEQHHNSDSFPNSEALDEDDEDDFAFGKGRRTSTSATPKAIEIIERPVPANLNTEQNAQLPRKIVTDFREPTHRNASTYKPLAISSITNNPQVTLNSNEVELEIPKPESGSPEDKDLPLQQEDAKAVTSGDVAIVEPDSNMPIENIVHPDPALTSTIENTQHGDNRTKAVDAVVSTPIAAVAREHRKRKPQEDSTPSGKRQRQNAEEAPAVRRSPRIQRNPYTPQQENPRKVDKGTDQIIAASPRRSPRLAAREAALEASSNNPKGASLVNDNISRKPTIIQFDRNGPSNQGTSSRSKCPLKKKSQIQSAVSKSASLGMEGNENQAVKYYKSDVDSPDQAETVEDLSENNEMRPQRREVISPGLESLQEEMSVDAVNLVEYSDQKNKQDEPIDIIKPHPLHPKKRQLNDIGSKGYIDGSNQPRKRQSISPPDKSNDENQPPQEHHETLILKPKAPSRQISKIQQGHGSLSADSRVQHRRFSKFNILEYDSPLANSKRQHRPMNRISSQSSRVDLNGSPIAPRSSQQTDQIGRVKGRLTQNRKDDPILDENLAHKTDQQPHPTTNSKHDRVAELFGPAIPISSSNKAKPSSPDSVQVRYIPHKRNPETGVYENLNGEETIPPEKPLANPFNESPREKRTKFTELLQSEGKSQRENVDEKEKDRKRRIAEALQKFFAGHDVAEKAEEAEETEAEEEFGGKTLINVEENQLNQVSSPAELTSGSSSISRQEEIRSPSVESTPVQSWNLVLRPHYHNLADAVHRVADEVLMKLADRETAIDTVVTQYETNATEIMDSFEKGRIHERSKMLQDLSQKKETMAKVYREARDAAVGMQDDIGGSPTTAFEREWEKRHKTVQRELEGTRRALLES